MNILILGGSKFMGLYLVESLISLKENQQVQLNMYIINRGKFYWNGYFNSLVSSKKDYIYVYNADRDDSVQLAEVLDKIFKNTSSKYFQHIIDFSCFNEHHVRSLLLKLQNHFRNYIFISTDSTYNSSLLALERNDEYFLDTSAIPLINESDLYLTDDKILKKKLKNRDEYGYNKIKCELEIKKIFEENNLIKQGITYIFLRLPDVVGTYDESLRLWIYMEWMKLSEIKKIEIEKVDLVRKLSFVSKVDVINFILKLILEYDTFKTKLNDQFNFNFDENCTLLEFLEILSDIIKIQNKDFYEIVDSTALTFYPSVTVGAIDNTKAKSTFDFKPSSLKKTISESVDFFNFVMQNYSMFKNEYLEMVNSLPKALRFKFKEI
jgi:nucleoside-diphosphate-sugar epimerase